MLETTLRKGHEREDSDECLEELEVSGDKTGRLIASVFITCAIGFAGATLGVHYLDKQAQEERYRTVQTLAETYGDRMTPEEFKDYLNDLGLTND